MSAALPAGYSLRAVVPADAERIAGHRLRMFLEAGWADDARMQAMHAAFMPWLQGKLASGDYFGWFVMQGEEVVAGLGMFWRGACSRYFDRCVAGQKAARQGASRRE